VEPTPSRRVALEAVAGGGSVVDVGCGAGAGSLPLVPPATALTAIDSSAEMLRAFAADAATRSVPYGLVEGRWPDVAGLVAPADLVVCHHVLYNVPDLVGFVLALTAHARRRVVVELTERHPLTELGPLWRRFHDLERPAGPDAGLAVEVIAGTGVSVRQERWERPRVTVAAADRVTLTRQRLCLIADRDGEVAAALEELGPPAPRQVRTLWWPGEAPG
jgi:SAM-dependent methyltransferase